MVVRKRTPARKTTRTAAAKPASRPRKRHGDVLGISDVPARKTSPAGTAGKQVGARKKRGPKGIELPKLTGRRRAVPPLFKVRG